MPETKLEWAYVGILVGVWSLVNLVWGAIFVALPVMKRRRLHRLLEEKGVRPAAIGELAEANLPGPSLAHGFLLHALPQSLRALLAAELAKRRDIRVTETAEDSISVLGRTALLPQVNLAPPSDFSSARIVIRPFEAGVVRVGYSISFSNLKRLAVLELLVVIIVVAVLQRFPVATGTKNLLSLLFVMMAALMFGLRCWAQSLSTRIFFEQAVANVVTRMPAP